MSEHLPPYPERKDLVVDLLFVDDCPHVERARQNLLTALRECGMNEHWEEWDLASSLTPLHLRGYGSPTILIDGRDLTGATDHANPGAAGAACRLDEVPSVDAIGAALRSSTDPPTGR